MSPESASSSAQSSWNMEEWKETRAVLARFDTALDGLRKYGFSFLAALFTVDVLHKLATEEKHISLALILITIAFICTLRLLDQNYQKFLEAASIRARILESILNIELTDTIAVKYKREKLDIYVLVLYIAFIGIATSIGLSVLPFFTIYSVIIILFALLGILIILLLYVGLDIDLARPITKKEDDWIIDKLSIELGENLQITVTNIGTDPIEFEVGKPIFEIWEEGTRGVEGNKAAYIEPMPRKVTIASFINYSWLWDSTKGGQRGKIYRLWPRGWDHPLPLPIVIRAVQTQPQPKKPPYPPYNTGTPSSPNLPWAR